MSPRAFARSRRLRPLLAALLVAGAAGACRRALTNPVDPESPSYGGEPVTIDPGPDLAGSIGDTLLFRGFYLGDTSRVAEYAWDFEGDGTIDWRGRDATAVPHAYRAVGVYPARFSARGIAGDGEGASIRATVTDEAPRGGIGPDTLVVPGEEILVVPRVQDDGRIVRYEWDLDADGNPDRVDAGGAPILISFPGLGDHVISLRVLDDDGRASTFGRRFRACPLPTPPLYLTPPDSAVDASARQTLSWTSESACAGPLTYDVYLDTMAVPERLVAINLRVPAYYAGVLPHYSTFRWRVVAKDVGGREQPSRVFTFNTRGLPFAMAFFEPAHAVIGSTLFPDETPLHDAYLDGFYMDQLETTRYDFTAFLNATGYVPEGSFTGSYQIGEETFPVSGVTWADAAAYSAWRGKRLPTEAEWEYAARGPRDAVYPWGNRIVLNPCLYANVTIPPDVACVGATVRTQSYPRGRSWRDIWDVCGNVAEWVADWYAPDYYRDPFA